MQFTDICIITNNVLDVVSFYESVFSVSAEGDEIHNSMLIGGLRLAVYDKSKAESEMGLDLSDSGTGLMTIGFNVDDVDVEYKRISRLNVTNLTEPVLWPWGAKSFNFKDIEGNLIFIRSWPS